MKNENSNERQGNKDTDRDRQSSLERQRKSNWRSKVLLKCQREDNRSTLHMNLRYGLQLLLWPMWIVCRSCAHSFRNP